MCSICSNMLLLCALLYWYNLVLLLPAVLLVCTMADSVTWCNWLIVATITILHISLYTTDYCDCIRPPHVVCVTVLYLIFYHPIIILMVWSYWKVIFTRVSTTPNQVSFLLILLFKFIDKLIPSADGQIKGVGYSAFVTVLGQQETLPSSRRIFFY